MQQPPFAEPGTAPWALASAGDLCEVKSLVWDLGSQIPLGSQQQNSHQHPEQPSACLTRRDAEE